MSTEVVTALAVRCDDRTGDRACPSALFVPTDSPAEPDLYAAERGWSVGERDLCPRHR